MLNFEWCSRLSLGWGRFLVILAFILPLIFALSLPRKYLYLGAPNQKLWRNLKLWVFLLVLAQVMIYLYF